MGLLIQKTEKKEKEKNVCVVCVCVCEFVCVLFVLLDRSSCTPEVILYPVFSFVSVRWY